MPFIEGRSMRAAVLVRTLLVFFLLAGCPVAGQGGAPVPLKSFVLSDVQGLFGGQSLWAAEDRTAYVQFAGRPPAGQSGMWETRYKTTLTANQWAEVERLVGVHRLLTVKMPDRNGVPDEARPAMTLVTRSGVTVTVAKWANDKHPGFDPVYGYLIELCRLKGELFREGPYDWQWKPEGF